MKERKWITTTIKCVYLDKIISGEKTHEFKGKTKFWKTRLDKLLDYDGPIGINLLCGQEAVKFDVPRIIWWDKEGKIDGKTYDSYYAIEIGERL